MAGDTYVLRVSEDGPMTLSVDDDVGVSFSDSEYIRYRHSEFPDYEGEYEVIPTLEGQTLETAEKVMRDDVTVTGIPVYRVSNPSGGYTIVIAQD